MTTNCSHTATGSGAAAGEFTIPEEIAERIESNFDHQNLDERGHGYSTTVGICQPGDSSEGPRINIATYYHDPRRHPTQWLSFKPSRQPGHTDIEGFFDQRPDFGYCINCSYSEFAAILASPILDGMGPRSVWDAILASDQRSLETPPVALRFSKPLVCKKT